MEEVAACLQIIFAITLTAGVITVLTAIQTKKRGKPLLINYLKVLIIIELNACLPFCDFTLYAGILMIKRYNNTVNEVTPSPNETSHERKWTDIVLLVLSPEKFLSNRCWYTESILLDSITLLTIAANIYMMWKLWEITYKVITDKEARKLIGSYSFVAWFLHAMKMVLPASTYCMLGFTINIIVTSIVLSFISYKLNKIKVRVPVIIPINNIYDRRYTRTVNIANARSVYYIRQQAEQRNNPTNTG